MDSEINQDIPLLDPGVPDALDDIQGGDVNLLPTSALQSDLKVTFPLWQGSSPVDGKTDTVVLMWDDSEVARKRFQTPIDVNELFSHVPVLELTEGSHALFYKAILSSANENASNPVTVTIDKTDPVLAGGNDPLKFPANLGNTVTARYLEDNGNVLPATVPAYDLPKPGDKILWYWEELPEGKKLTGEKTLTQADMSLGVEFDGAMIVASGDGTRYATYRVQDRAGNLSELSERVTLTVNAQPVPHTPPSVDYSEPTTGGKGELDPLLVTGGAVVTVPDEIKPQPGDTLTVHWKGAVPSASHETSEPIEPGGLEFAIPPSKIPGNIGLDKVVEVYHTLTAQGGTDPQPSEKYFLTILPIAENRFPKPQCVQAAGTPATLRLSSVPNGANFLLDPWVFISPGQKMHMWIGGVDKNNGSDLKEDVFTDRALTEDESNTGVDALLPRSFLERLKLNAVFWADIGVSFDGGESFLGFPRQDLTLVV